MIAEALAAILLELLAERTTLGVWKGLHGSSDERCARASAKDALVRVATSTLKEAATGEQVRQLVDALDNAISQGKTLPPDNRTPIGSAGPAQALRRQIAGGLQILYEPLDSDGTTQADVLGITMSANSLTDQLVEALIEGLATNLSSMEGSCKLMLQELRHMQDEAAVPSSSPIHARYLLCRSYEVMAEIARGELRSLPGVNVLLVPTPIVSTWRAIAKEHGSMRLPQVWGDSLADKAAYLGSFPQSVEIDRSSTIYPAFETRRPATQTDLERYVLPRDALSRYLAEAGIQPAQVAEVFGYYERCGTRDPAHSFQELLHLREAWILLLQVTALADGVTLERVEGLSYPAHPLEVNSQPTAESVVVPSSGLPRATLRLDQSVLIPLATLIPPLGFEPATTYWAETDKDAPREWASEASSAHLGVGLDEFLALGPVSNPTAVRVRTSDTVITIGVHRFDPRRVYVVSTRWFAGSCPHLFEIHDHGLEYAGPMFGYRAGVLQRCTYEPTSRALAIVLVELEDEVTDIREVRHGSTVLVDRKRLIPGDAITVHLIPSMSGPITFTGTYYPLSDFVAVGAMFERNQLVAAFMKDFLGGPPPAALFGESAAGCSALGSGRIVGGR